MEQATVFLKESVDTAWQLTANAWSVSASVWLPISLSILFCVFVLRIALEVLPLFLRRQKSLKDIRVSITTSPENDIVYLTTESMNQLFGDGQRPEVLRIRSKEQKAYARLARRNKGTLQTGVIELNTDMFQRLFPKAEIPTGEGPKLVEEKLDIQEHAASGLVGYWLAPNDRVRFQNQFAVYLGVGLVFFQILLELVLPR